MTDNVGKANSFISKASLDSLLKNPTAIQRFRDRVRRQQAAEKRGGTVDIGHSEFEKENLLNDKSLARFNARDLMGGDSKKIHADTPLNQMLNRDGSSNRRTTRIGSGGAIEDEANSVGGSVFDNINNGNHMKASLGAHNNTDINRAEDPYTLSKTDDIMKSILNDRELKNDRSLRMTFLCLCRNNNIELPTFTQVDSREWNDVDDAYDDALKTARGNRVNIGNMLVSLKVPRSSYAKNISALGKVVFRVAKVNPDDPKAMRQVSSFFTESLTLMKNEAIMEMLNKLMGTDPFDPKYD